jgi:hypothetical protein
VSLSGTCVLTDVSQRGNPRIIMCFDHVGSDDL